MMLGIWADRFFGFWHGEFRHDVSLRFLENSFLHI